jgi:hypothetical protein
VAVARKGSKTGLVVALVLVAVILGGGVILAVTQSKGDAPGTAAATPATEEPKAAVATATPDAARAAATQPAAATVAAAPDAAPAAVLAAAAPDAAPAAAPATAPSGHFGSANAEADAIDPKNFDVTGFIPRATAIARDAYDDAVLVRIDVKGVRVDGTADLVLAEGDALYRFQSPKRSVPEKGRPLGAPARHHECIYYVSVEASGQVRAHPVDWECDYPLIGAPKCSAAEVWAKAKRMGAPSTNAIAELGYWADDHGHGRWMLEIGSAFSNWIPDSCAR